MDLTPVYIFHALIAAVLSYGVVTIADFKVRRIVFVFLLAILASATNFAQIERDHAVSRLTDRIDAANAEIIRLAKCQSTEAICDWSTK